MNTSWRLLFGLVGFISLFASCSGGECVYYCTIVNEDSTIVLPKNVEVATFFSSHEPLGDSVLVKFYGVPRSGNKIFEILISEEKNVKFKERQLQNFNLNLSTVISFQGHATFDNERQRLTVYDENEIDFEFEFDQKYTPQVLPGRQLIVKNNEYFFINSSKEILVDNAKNSAYYYKTVSPILSLDMSNEATIRTIGSFPESHITSVKALSDFYPSCVVNNAGDIVASFSSNDSIFVLVENGERQESFKASSCLSEVYPALSFNEIMDMAKVKQLQTEAPMYIQLFYNQFRSEYYRIYRHNWTKPSEKGKVSVIVLNSDFEKQCEILLDANEIYFGNLIPSRKGFLAVDLLETKRLGQLALKNYEL
jgi:hypothetical protein